MPVEAIAKHDMNFGIYLDGELIGTTMFGVPEWDRYFETSEEKNEFLSLLDAEAQKEEAALKFKRQFGVSIEDAGKLNFTAIEIIDLMEEKWNVPVEVMDEVLGTYI
jgi:hypothetical protein